MGWKPSWCKNEKLVTPRVTTRDLGSHSTTYLDSSSYKGVNFNPCELIWMLRQTQVEVLLKVNHLYSIYCCCFFFFFFIWVPSLCEDTQSWQEISSQNRARKALRNLINKIVPIFPHSAVFPAIKGKGGAQTDKSELMPNPCQNN